MTTVKMLTLCLILLSISGCTKVSYIKCSTPNVTKPILDNTKNSDILLNSKKCIKNYILIKAYASELELANKVCK